MRVDEAKRIQTVRAEQAAVLDADDTSSPGKLTSPAADTGGWLTAAVMKGVFIIGRGVTGLPVGEGGGAGVSKIHTTIRTASPTKNTGRRYGNTGDLREPSPSCMYGSATDETFGREAAKTTAVCNGLDPAG